MPLTSDNQQVAEIVPYNFNDIYNDISAKFAEAGYDTASGSNISQLVTSMAYAVSMLNANTAMNINETILAYANRRENVLATARNLNYEAKHKVSYVYKITLQSKTGTFIIPKYMVFTQGETEYVYMGKQLEIYGEPSETLSITVKEGKIYQYTDSEALHGFISSIEGAGIPQYYIDIPFINVEDDGIEVLCTYMDEYGVLHEKEQWEKAESLHIEIDQDEDVKQFFRIDNIEYGTPRLYFRYSGIGKPLLVGTEVFINVLESHGSKGEMDLDDVQSITCPDDDISCIAAELVSAGSDEESTGSVRANAPLLHNSSNRLVVANDYIAACKRDQRVKNCVVWGGEDEFPKAPGHIWFSFLPPGTHKFTSNESKTIWERDDVTYEWDYAAVDKTEQEKNRDDYYRLNYLAEASIKSPYRNDDGSVANPGIWDRLNALKIPTLVYHHRAPIYCEFSYQIEIAKYLAYDSKSSMHSDMFDIIDSAFTGEGDSLAYEDFSVQYFDTNIIKRLDARSTDQSGFNIALDTQLVLNAKCLAIENLQPEYKDIYIPLATPFESYFDRNGYLMIERLPNIDTKDFVYYLDDGIKGYLYTDWSLIREDIESNKRQIQHKMIYAPIVVQWKYDYSFKDRTETNKVLLPFEVQPDDYLQTGEPDAQYTFNKTLLTLMKKNELDEYDETELKYGIDWYWDPDDPEIIRLAPIEVTDDDLLRIKCEAQAGWYYLFNTNRKEILVHLFVDGTKKGFNTSLGGDWSKDPSADLRENYLYSYDDYYGYSNDNYYHYTKAAEHPLGYTTEQDSDNWANSESNLSSNDSYVETTNTQPRSFLTTLDGTTLTTIDHWYLTTNGYILTDETERNSYTGPIVREINKYMYIRSPLKEDLFDRNRYLNLKYLSSNFAVIRNVMPLLKRVEFYSLSDSDTSQNLNFVMLTLSLQGGEIIGDTTIQVNKGITWGLIKEQIKSPTKVYSTFRHWSLETYGDAIEDTEKFTANTTIYAVWKTKTCNIAIDGNGGSVTPERLSVKAGTTWGAIEDAVKAERESFIMDGFSTSSGSGVDRISRYDNILDDANVYVRWVEHKTITITFESNDGSTQPPLEVLSGYKWSQIKEQTQTPIKDGFVFSHWCYDAELRKKVADDDIISESCTLYAAYIERLVEIVFDMQGGRPIANEQAVKRNTTWQIVKQKLTSPTKSNNLFIGWSLTNDLEVRELLTDEFIFSEYNYTIYALFTNKICTIRFSMNGGTPQQQYIVVERGTKWSDISLSEPSKQNFKFLGWSLTPDGSTLEDDYTFEGSETTLYAIWTYDGSIIYFNSQGGTTVSPLKVARNTKWGDIRYTVKEPTRTNYKFLAWSLKPDDPTPIADSEKFVEDTYNAYAHWEWNGSNIVFDTQGGSNVKNITVIKGTTWGQIKGTVETTVKDGFTFKWWSLMPEGEAISDSEVFNDDTEPVYAVWADITDPTRL